MRQSLKAPLLSALVFPGLGQFALRRRWRGVLFMLAVIVGLGFVVLKASQLASGILEKIVTEGGALDVAAISDAVTQAMASTQGRGMGLAFWFAILAWALSVADAWWLGRQADAAARQERGSGPI